LRYDNMADPTKHDSNDFAWRTKFWSLGFSTDWGEFVLLAQAMIGSTVIAPSPSFVSTTDFWAAYVLLGWQRQDWRYAVRFDKFGTNEIQPAIVPPNGEHGVALSAAISWSPVKWMRLTGELLEVDSWRAQRLSFGQSPHAIETQVQLSLKVFF
jgi:hypothetical protein